MTDEVEAEGAEEGVRIEVSGLWDPVDGILPVVVNRQYMYTCIYKKSLSFHL